MVFMSPAQKMALLMSAYNAIFETKMKGVSPEMIKLTTNCGEFRGKWFAQSLYGVDFDLAEPNGTKHIRMLEQNPNKTDAAGNLKYHANMARQGHRIVWVIDKSVKENGFIGRIQDGQWIASGERATQPANNTARVNNTAAVSQPIYEEVIETLPEIDGDFPEAVLAHFAEAGEDEWPEVTGGYDPDIEP